MYYFRVEKKLLEPNSIRKNITRLHISIRFEMALLSTHERNNSLSANDELTQRLFIYNTFLSFIML